MRNHLIAAMMTGVVVFAAPADAQSSDNTAASAYVDVATRVCLPLAQGHLSLGVSTPEQDMKAIEQLGLQFGVTRQIYERLGNAAGLLNRAVMGSLTVGNDVVVLAVGGSLPGCKVLFLQEADEDLGSSIVAAILGSENNWRELPFSPRTPGAVANNQSFLARDKSGAPFLLNLITAPPSPDSDLRAMILISPVPSNIQIPEGY